MNKKKNILVITSYIDSTVDYIINKYQDKAYFFRLDIDRLADYTIDIGGLSHWSITNLVNRKRIEKKDVYSIYYRKPLFPDLSEFEDRYISMIQRDIVAVITGIADDFEGKVLSKPSVLKKTENKIFQLLYVLKRNTLIPVSYIGNNNIKCIDFAKKNSIIKPITTGKVKGDGYYEIFQTSLFEEFDDDVSLTPVYVQEYIGKKYEVRITVIDNNIYAVRIDTDNKLDWRRDYENHKYTLIDVPIIIKEFCLQMLIDFNLSFGAFDFIVSQDDKWYFLEVNPNGQWLWLEQDLQLDISKKIIEFLIGEVQ